MKLINKNTKLNENKTKIDTEVVTALISQAWGEIGVLKSNVEQIGKGFSDTKKLIEIFEDLLDSYLIYVGRLESFLEDSKLIDKPKNKEVIEEKLILDENKYTSTIIEHKPIEISQPVDMSINESVASKSIDALLDTETESNDLDAEQENEVHESADFFVDFDEPDLSEPKLTDDDIYGKQ